MNDPGGPPLPEALLAPLLDTAADRLRDLAPADVPLSLRPLVGFDRRGLSRGAARQQLLRALEGEEGFRKEMFDRFLERPEVNDALERWSSADAVALADDAADRADLPFLASVLYAARPDGWIFGLGAVVATYERRRTEQAVDDDVKALQTRVANLDEARRRAESARDEAAASVQRVERELRDERRSRRAREEEAQRHADVAARRAEALERELAEAREKADAIETRLRREVERVRGIESELRTARADTARAERELADALEADPGRAASLSATELQALADAAELARRVADGLGVLAGRTSAARETPSPGTKPAGASASTATAAPAAAPRPAAGKPGRERSRRPRVPGGLVADTPEGVGALLRTPGVVMVVDGYNVSMRGWPDAPPSLQRDRLVAGLTELQLRTRCGVVCVFDGADVGPVPSSRRSGVRVVFSKPGEDADPVVVREVASRSGHGPVLAVSSDGWVREHAEASGALVVGANALLGALRG
ncbi:MAG TPA: NYN domain-containing protein [Acidimicrobiia bacterium]